MKKILFFLLLLAIPFIVYAEECSPNSIILTSIELKNTTGKAEDVETNIENNKINMNVRLKEVGDTAEYEVKVRNNSSEEYYLNNATVTNSNEYVNYEITYEDNSNIVQPQSNKQVNIRVEYKKEVPENLLEDNKYINNNTLVLDIANEKISNPKTLNPIVYIIVVMIGIIILPFFMNIRKRLYVLIIMGLIMIPLSVYAVCNANLECNANVEVYKGPALCKRATSLHTKTCSRTAGGCYSAGYYSGGSKGTSSMTFGSLGTSGVLSAGDAFDCDVNNDGAYDPETERFYYVTDEDNNAVLIAYKNYRYGTPSYFYNAITNLPNTTEWSNPLLVLPTTRPQKYDTGELTNNVQDYTGKAGRLLTVQEIKEACGDNVKSVGDLDSCTYFLENTVYEVNYYADYWLDNIYKANTNDALEIYGYERKVSDADKSNYLSPGVRPAIVVRKSDMDY